MSSYLVLARRWRPRTFQSLVGQGHVTRALVHALETGRVPHAFLFSGIRGVGKTTLARLLAMCLDCEKGVSADPCGQCGSCQEIIAGNHPDVFEVDAASRTKVEQMRELLDMVGYSPAVSRHKIFILDEIHMLSTQSFNALLKTLEEPPAHVKFIFATTEPRKIPTTILSRCQHYNLKRVSPDILTAHLVTILEKEATPFEPLALAAIVRAAEGSVRDALSLLDQVISHGAGAVKFDAAKELLGLTDRESIQTLLTCIVKGKGVDVLQGVTDFYNKGVEPGSIVRELLDLVHEMTREKLLEKQAQDRIALADISLEHLQMVYQVLLRGSQDLRLAENSLQALEMLLLRVTYLKPVPSLDKLLAQLRRSPVSAGVPPAAVSRASEEKVNTVVVENVPLLGDDLLQKDRESLTSWEQLVSSAARRDSGLGVKLRTQLSCLEFDLADPASSRIVLRLAQDILGSPTYFKQLVETFLRSLGREDVSVLVEDISEAPRPKTVEETASRQREERQMQRLKTVEDHPIVLRTVSRFQAEVVHVGPFVGT